MKLRNIAGVILFLLTSEVVLAENSNPSNENYNLIDCKGVLTSSGPGGNPAFVPSSL